MDITPSLSLIEVSQCDGTEITANLFKEYPIPPQQKERLRTYLRIRNADSLRLNGEIKCYEIQNSRTLKTIPPEDSQAFKNRDESKPRNYTFSHIFPETTTQSTIYEHCSLPLVKRFLNGDNCLLFVYGITSSGKSYTMQGDTANPGIIPRAFATIFDIIGDRIVREPRIKPDKFCDAIYLNPNETTFELNLSQFIFDTTDKKSSNSLSLFRSQMSSIINSQLNLDASIRSEIAFSSHKYSIWVSFVEFYNETLIDLLGIDIGTEKTPKLMILQDGDGNYFIKGLRQIRVASAEEAFKALLFGQNKLKIFSTNLNRHSSRSHCAFNITIMKIEENINRCVGVNTISFCDLAGSERSNKTNNAGDRLKETGYINTSLLSLSKCIAAIRYNQGIEKNKVPRLIPFRHSKLTKVFQPFLTGNGIANMIVNINPIPSMFDETIVALKFSAIASQVIVSNDVRKHNIQVSLKRLTQIWMQSTQRWSTFAEACPKKDFPKQISGINAIPEEDENSDSDDDDGDMTIEEMINENVKRINEMDLTRIDPQYLEMLQNQIEYLNDKLKNAESEKFEMEMEIRAQAVAEIRKLTTEMQLSADTKESAKKRMENNYNVQIKELKRIVKEQRNDMKSQKKKFEDELFKEREKNCNFEEELKNRDKQYDDLKLRLLEIENRKELKSIHQLDKSILVSAETIDVSAETSAYVSEEKSTSVMGFEQIDAITDTNDLEFIDSVNKTDAIIKEDKCVSTDLIHLKDAFTNTTDLLKTNEKETDMTLIDFGDVCTSYSIVTEDKGTNTEIGIKSKDLCRDASVSASVNCADIALSPHMNVNISNDKPMNESIGTSTNDVDVVDGTSLPHMDVIPKEEHEKVIAEHEKCNEKMRYFQAQIDFNRELVKSRDNENKVLKDEIIKLKNEMKNSTDIYKWNCNFKPKPISSNSEIFDISSQSSLNEINKSNLKMEQNEDKSTKKQKFSRKKPLNSPEKQYLHLQTVKYEDSEPSTNSQSSKVDDDLQAVCFTEKKKTKKRRRNDKDKEETPETKEEFNKTVSKRKRVPTKDMSTASITPIFEDQKESVRITRSKMRKKLF